jgi:hypothetical protein
VDHDFAIRCISTVCPDGTQRRLNPPARRSGQRSLRDGDWVKNRCADRIRLEPMPSRWFRTALSMDAGFAIGSHA